MTSLPPSQPLPIALRAFLQPPEKRNGGAAWKQPEPSDWQLVFDVETTTDAAQICRFVAYQVRCRGELRQMGLAFDPQTLDDADRQTFLDFASDRGIEAITVERFVEDVFFPVAYDLAGHCIGFNLPFDLSRLAIRHVAARDVFKGGYSFQLSPNALWPWIRVKHLNARAAMIQFRAPAGRSPERQARELGAAIDHHRGHFCDVKSLGGGLTGQAHSLASLARLLDTPHKKIETDEHGGPLTPQYLAYALNDVQVTWECFAELRPRYESYGLTRTPLTKIKSEASIGKASLEEMGIQPWLKLQPEFPPELLGIVMSTYFGGRAAVRLRRMLVRVLYCDFLSMYPTTCTLQGLWEYVRAERVEHEDATEETEALLERLTLADLQRPEFWRSLQVLVQVEPRGDLFPTRGDYVGNGQYAIGLNYLTCGPVWFTLADCIASTLRTGKPPRVLKALRFRPVGIQQGLRPLNVAGNPAYRVDPASDDLYRRLIDLRTEVKGAKAKAKTGGNPALAAQIDAEQLALKIMANAVSYGIFVELNVRELGEWEERNCYGYEGRRFATRVKRVEEPGRYFHPLLATLITGSARLMLVLAECLAEQEGLFWVFCDTDSMALGKPEEMSEEEFLERAERVCDWFRPLNPYAQKGPLFKIEDANYRLDGDGKLTEELVPLYAVAISAKRHALFNLDEPGRPVIRKASAHGLGHLEPPYDEKHAPKSIPAPVLPLHELGVERWQYDVWYRIAEAVLAGKPDDLAFDDLEGLDRPAMMSYAATTPSVLGWFDTCNRLKPYTEQLRPFGFFLVPLVARDGYPLDADPQRFLPFASYSRDAAQWSKLRYTNAHAPGDGGYAISTHIRGERVARVQSYREIVLAYAVHPEPKSLGSDGLPCRPTTVGFLSPCHVEAVAIEHIGKESNRVEEVGIVGAEDVYLHYPDAGSDPWRRWALPALKDFPAAEIARLSGLSRDAVSDLLRQETSPQSGNRTRLVAAAARLARTRLHIWGATPHRNDLASLSTYARERDRRGRARSCVECAKPLGGPRKERCDACKQRAYRSRAKSRLVRARRGPLRNTPSHAHSHR